MRFGDTMYIVQFQDPARELDRIFGSRVEQTFDFFMRKPMPRAEPASTEPTTAGIGASQKLKLAFPQMVAASPSSIGARRFCRLKRNVFVDTFTRTGFAGGINWYRNMRATGSAPRASITPCGYPRL
jgi:hypothetical protein